MTPEEARETVKQMAEQALKDHPVLEDAYKALLAEVEADRKLFRAVVAPYLVAHLWRELRGAVGYERREIISSARRRLQKGEQAPDPHARGLAAAGRRMLLDFLVPVVNKRLGDCIPEEIGTGAAEYARLEESNGARRRWLELVREAALAKGGPDKPTRDSLTEDEVQDLLHGADAEGEII